MEESDYTIPLEITLVIKELSVVSPVVVAATPATDVTTIAHLFSFLALLPTPPPHPPLAAAMLHVLSLCCQLPSPPLLIVALSFSRAALGYWQTPPSSSIDTIPFLFYFIVHQYPTTGRTLPMTEH